MVATSPMAKMLPLLPFTRRYWSVVMARKLVWDPSGRLCCSCCARGLSLMPVHQMHTPNLSSRFAPSWPTRRTKSRSTPATLVLRRRSMSERKNWRAAYSEMRRSYVDRMWSCSSTTAAQEESLVRVAAALGGDGLASLHPQAPALTGDAAVVHQVAVQLAHVLPDHVAHLGRHLHARGAPSHNYHRQQPLALLGGRVGQRSALKQL